MRRPDIATRFFTALLIMSLAVLTTFSIPVSEASVDSTKTPYTTVELKAKIDSLLKEYKIPGSGFALVSKDSILWIECFGYANVETGEPVTENTLFCVASCTKSFLGLGFLKLIEAGKIDITTPVSDIAPEIEINNRWQDTHPIRVVHLLEHTAGFDDIHPSWLINKDDPEMPLRQAVEIKAKILKARWQPGTRRAYSSPGYTLAGYVLEKITGRQYEDYLKDNILEPIGMKNSSFRLTKECKQLLAQGYDDNYQPIPYIIGYDRPASSLNSSTKDMALFMQFLLNKGKIGEQQILSEESIDRLGIHTTTVAAKAGLTEGYGFGVGSSFKYGFKWYTHSGGGPGYIAKYAYLKDQGLGFVALGNYFNPYKFEEICDVIQEYLIRDIDPPQKPSIKLSTDQLEKYIGYYEYLSPRQDLLQFINTLMSGISISVENDTLYTKEFLEGKKALIPVSPNTFRRSESPEAGRVFTTTSEGVMVYATKGSYYEKTGIWKIYIYRTLVFGMLIIMISGILYAVFWIPVHLYKKLRRKENRSKYLRMRVIPLLAMISLIIGFYAVGNQSMTYVGTMTMQNIVFFISTLLFAGLSVLSVIYSLISFKKPVKKTARIYALVLSLSCTGITVYFSYWGIIGLRLWAY